MKHHPTRGHTGRMPAWYCRLLSVAAVIACSFLPSQADAQMGGTNSMFYRLYGPAATSYEPYTDAKGFSTEVIGTTRESVMAGTLYDPNRQWGIPFFVHFLDGSINNTNPIGGAYPDPMGTNDVVIYPDPAFYHQRVVDIAVGENFTTNQACFITVSAREDITNPAPRDRIKVIQTDYTGASSGSDFIISDLNMSSTPGIGCSLYPTHTLYKNVGGTKTLYICGYVTQDATVGAASGPYPVIPMGTPGALPYPEFTSVKQAFVMSIDVGVATPTLIACRYYDWAYNGGTTNPVEFDFDMAMHMTELSANYGNGTATAGWAGDIHITGSVTAKTGLYNGPTTPTVPMPYTIVRSATMNMIVDDANLTINFFGNNPFISAGNGDGYGKSEYGVAFVEGPSGRDHYIVSNLYEGYPNGGGPSVPNGYTIWQPMAYGGFNLKPEAFTVTHTNHWGFAHTGAPFNRRLRFNNGAWAMQTLPSYHPLIPQAMPFMGTESRFVIAGLMHTDPNMPSSMATPPSNANITPFLYDVQTEFSGGTGAFVGNTVKNVATFTGTPPQKDFVAYPNQTGTGTPGTDANNYLTLGSDFSSVLWGPTFADKYDGTQDFVFSAPKWDKLKPTTGGAILPPYNFLGIKAIFAHTQDYHIAWGGCIEEFNLSPQPEEIEGIGGTAPYTGMVFSDAAKYQFTDIDILVVSPVGQNNAQYDKYGDCTGGYHSQSGNPVFKTGTTGVSGIRLQNAATRVYPNPAKDAVYLQLSANIATEANIKVILTNVHGQAVKELYNGLAENLGVETALQLPQVATGLYIVQVFSNGAIVHQQKLSIQQ
ncbi:MAG: T9SS type A sorting domain-containing protein [Flavipsychrobacter sp.]|nr:T9SS type A sorting domain-containing protein [Flavipsychrobacter sp.]